MDGCGCACMLCVFILVYVMYTEVAKGHVHCVYHLMFVICAEVANGRGGGGGGGGGKSGGGGGGGGYNADTKPLIPKLPLGQLQKSSMKASAWM